LITNLLIDLLFVMIGGLVTYLPDMSGVISTINGWSGSVGALGQYLGAANAAVPVTEILTFVAAVAALLPVILAYRVFSWIWRHVPEIWGFGTGNG